MYLIVAAIIPLAIAPQVWRTSKYRGLVRWYALGALGNSLWILSYAGIELAPTDHLALWATRSAWIGPIIGAPTFYLFCRSIARPNIGSRTTTFLLFAASLFVHLPAVLGPYAVVSIDRSDSAPRWEYGPWAAIPVAFWITIFAASMHVLIKNWAALPWTHRNRVLILLTGFVTTLPVGIVTNQILLVVLGDNRFYLVGPIVSVIPFVILSWVLSEEWLPDFFGAVGRIFPNARSRFLDALDQFEKTLTGFGSRESAINRLSALVGGRIVPLPADVSGLSGYVRTEPWIAPEAKERLYGRRDVSRIERIIFKIDQQIKNAVRVSGVIVTGWDTRSSVNEPRRVLWPVGTVRSLRAAERAKLLLETEPILLVQSEPDEVDTIMNGVRDYRLRPDFIDVEYPDAADDGKSSAIALLEKCRVPRDTMLFVRLSHGNPASEFNTAVSALVADGARLIVASTVPAESLLQNAAINEPDLALGNMPRMDLPHTLSDPDEVSFLIDHYLLDIESRYHVHVPLGPEDRLELCQAEWTSGREELRFRLERLALERAGIVPPRIGEVFA